MTTFPAGGWNHPWTRQQQDLQVIPMQALTQIPVLHAAVEYSLLYMLFGGGIFGAAVIYFIARAMGK